MTDLDPKLASLPMAQALAGCDWGRTVALPDDMEHCGKRAVQLVMLHYPDGQEYTVRLCLHHYKVLEEHTDPRKEESCPNSTESP